MRRKPFVQFRSGVGLQSSEFFISSLSCKVQSIFKPESPSYELPGRGGELGKLLQPWPPAANRRCRGNTVHHACLAHL